MNDPILKIEQNLALIWLVRAFEEARKQGYELELVEGNSTITVPEGFTLEGGQDDSENCTVRLP